MFVSQLSVCRGHQEIYFGEHGDSRTAESDPGGQTAALHPKLQILERETGAVAVRRPVLGYLLAGRTGAVKVIIHPNDKHPRLISGRTLTCCSVCRYLLDNHAVCRGKTVLDLGSGCGASAIAAKLSGAAHVVANDIDAGMHLCVL